MAIGKLSLLLLHIQDDAVINQKGRAISSLPGKNRFLNQREILNFVNDFSKFSDFFYGSFFNGFCEFCIPFTI